MRQLRLLCLFTSALLAVAGPAGAITIDDFTVGDTVTDTATGGGPVPGVASPAVLGGSSVFGTRSITAEMLSDGGFPAAFPTTTNSVGGGIWSPSNSITVIGTSTLLYLPAPATTVDLSTGGIGLIRFGFLGADGTSTITIVAASAGGAESTAIFMPGTVAATIDVLFSSFIITGGGGAADFSMLDSLAIISTNTAAGADSFFTLIGVPNVPEPATLTLFGGALLALALLRKRVSK